MKNRSNSASGGITFMGLLQVAFIVLKLCGVIKWHWLWVLAPMWISTIVLLLIFFVIILIAKR